MTKPLKLPSYLWLCFWFLLIGLYTYIAFLSHNLQIRQYDEIDYLINSRVFSGLYDDFVNIRPPLISFLYLPLTYFCGKNFECLFHISGIQASMISLIGVLAFYFSIRNRFSKTVVVLSTIFVASHPFYLHHAPMVMTDIPALIAITLVMMIILREETFKSSLQYQALLSISICMAVLFRPNLAILYPFFFVTGAILCFSKNSSLGLKFIKASIYAVFLQTITSIVFLSWVYGSFTKGINTHYHVFYHLVFLVTKNYQIDTHLNQSYFYYLYKNTSIFEILFFFLGIFTVLKKRKTNELIIFALLVFGFTHLQTLKSSKETRYLLPLFPLIYFTIAHGLERSVQWASQKTHIRRFSVFIILIILLFPITRTKKTLGYFNQEFFHQTFLFDVIEHLEKTKNPSKQIYWINNYYALYPKELKKTWGVHSDIYHLSHEQIANFLNQKITWLEPDQAYREMDMIRGLAHFLEDGDIAIMSHLKYYLLHTAPEKIPPIKIIQWKRMDLSLRKMMNPSKFKDWHLFIRPKGRVYFTKLSDINLNNDQKEAEIIAVKPIIKDFQPIR